MGSRNRLVRRGPPPAGPPGLLEGSKSAQEPPYGPNGSGAGSAALALRSEVTGTTGPVVRGLRSDGLGPGGRRRIGIVRGSVSRPNLLAVGLMRGIVPIGI